MQLLNVKLDRPGLSPPLNGEAQSDEYKKLKKFMKSPSRFYTAEEKKRHPHVFNCVRKSILWVDLISHPPSQHTTRGMLYRTGLFGGFPYLVCFKTKPVNWTNDQWTRSQCVGRVPGTALEEFD